MQFRFSNVTTVALTIGIGLGFGCSSGSGCLTLAALPSAPTPFGMPASQIIEGGIQARVTPPGFKKLTSIISTLAESQLAGGICAIPPEGFSEGSVGGFPDTGIKAGVCGDNACAGGAAGCPADIILNSKDRPSPNNVDDGLDKISLSLANGDNPVLTLNMSFDINVPLDVEYGFSILGIGTSGTCHINLYDAHYRGQDNTPIAITAPITISTSATTGELAITLGNVTTGPLDLDVDSSDCSTLGSLLDDLLKALDFVANLSSTIRNFVVAQLTPALQSAINNLLPKPLGLAGTMSASSLLASFNPPADANLELFIVPGGYVSGLNQGLNLGVMTGFNSDRDQSTRTGALASEPSLCVPARPLFDLTQAPYMLAPTSRNDFALNRVGNFNGSPEPTDPSGGTSDIALGVSKAMLQDLGFHIFNSGTLCLTIGGALLSQLNAGTLGLLVPSLGNVLENTSAPLQLVLRPQTPLTFAIGAGTSDDALLQVQLNDLRIDFYTFIEERYVRLLTVGLDLVVGLNLNVTMDASGNPVLQPVLLALDSSKITARVGNTDLLQENGSSLAQIFPGVLSAAIGAIGGSVPNISLPALPGFTLTNLTIGRVQAPQDDYLSITADLNTGTPMPLTDWSDPVHPRRAGQLHTQARIESKVVPTADQLLALLKGQSREHAPSVTVVAAADGGNGSAVEYSWRLDHGLWRPWSDSATLVVSDASLLIQGHHSLDVRSRQKGDWTSEDPAPAELDVLIDSMPPKLAVHGDSDGKRMLFSGSDLVSPSNALTYSWVDGGGRQRPFARMDGLTIAEVSEATANGQKALEVSVRDEAGNVTTQKVDSNALLSTGASAPGCSVGGRGTTSPLSLLLAGLVGLVLLARRRRALVSGLLATALLVSVSGCNHSAAAKVLQCRVDDDCATSHPCADGTLPTCTNNMCGCGNDVDIGHIGRFTSMVAIGGEAYVSAYNSTYGDLMIGHVVAPGIVTNWDFVDGVPEEPPQVTGSHVRGGITDPGDDVGRYTSIARAPSGSPVIAYYDATHGALKYASFGAIRWHNHTVDVGVGPPPGPVSTDVTGADDTGRYSSLTFSPSGNPAIAYAAVAHENTQSGQPETQLRWAEARVPNPSSQSDWMVTILDSTPFATTAVDGGLPVPNDALLQPNVGLMPSVARRSDGSAAVAYYDRPNGNLKYVEYVASAGTWSTPRILDGQNANGVNTGDVGAYPALAFDSMDVAHIAYYDNGKGRLLYVSPGGTPSVIDSGYHPMDEMTLDGLPSPVYHLAGSSTSLLLISDLPYIAYQDQTTLTLKLAASDGQGGWDATTIAGHAAPFTGSFGFYAGLQSLGGQLIISSYGINQQQAVPSFFVQVFAESIGDIGSQPNPQ